MAEHSVSEQDLPHEVIGPRSLIGKTLRAITLQNETDLINDLKAINLRLTDQPLNETIITGQVKELLSDIRAEAGSHTNIKTMIHLADGGLSRLLFGVNEKSEPEISLTDNSGTEAKTRWQEMEQEYRHEENND